MKLTFDVNLINFCFFNQLTHRLRHLRTIINDDEELFSAIVVYCRSLIFVQLNLMAVDDFSVRQVMFVGCCPSQENYRYLSEKIPKFAPNFLALGLILEPISAVTLLFPQVQPIEAQAPLPSSLSVQPFDASQLLFS